MASLRRHPKSQYWIACFSDAEGRPTQRSTKCTDKGEAWRIALKFEDAAREARGGRLVESQARRVIADIYAIANKEGLPTSSIRGFLQTWVKRKEMETGEKTSRRYEIVTDQFTKFLGQKANRDLMHLTSRDVLGFRDELASRVTASTVNISIKVLRVALNQAKRDGFVNANEAERVSLLRHDRFQRRAFTLRELKTILSRADTEWKGMILTGIYTGLRLGDIALLTWDKVDLERGQVQVGTAKTGRIVALPIARPLLRHFKTLPRTPRQPVFPEAHAQQEKSPYSGVLSRRFYQILVSAGLVAPRTHDSTGKGRSAKRAQNELSFHCLRHTATSLLKNANVSDAIARDIIGHESAAVSANYTHIDMKTKRKAVNSLPDILG
jgi:integrase